MGAAVYGSDAAAGVTLVLPAVNAGTYEVQELISRRVILGITTWDLPCGTGLYAHRSI